MTATGNELDDVLFVFTAAVPVSDDDEYCVDAGSRLLREITDSEPLMSRSQIHKDDAWASIHVGENLGITLSIVWVTEEEDKHTWALQFALRRGCMGLLRSRRMTTEELRVRESIELGAKKAPSVSDVRLTVSPIHVHG